MISWIYPFNLIYLKTPSDLYKKAHSCRLNVETILYLGSQSKPNGMWTTLLSFAFVMAMVSWLGKKWMGNEDLDTQDGYFLGGRSLTGIVIAGSLIMTNISTEHLVGMNGSAYKNGALVITWEVTSAIALVIAALFFAPQYLKIGLTTLPELLEKRFDAKLRSYVDIMLIISFIFTLLPIVLYTGAISIEHLFGIAELLGVNQATGIWVTVLITGTIGAIYAIYGGLKMVAVTDTLFGFGLIVGGLTIPMLGLLHIGDGDLFQGWTILWSNAREKFNVISDEPSIGPGARDAILPFSVLFTGMIINQLYFWAMHQSIIQRVLGAASLKEAQKGLLYTGILTLTLPLIIILPGIIAFQIFGDRYYGHLDQVYPALVKMLLPQWATGFFIAIIAGAVLSTFNSGLNSAATLFSLGIYKKLYKPQASHDQVVRTGKKVSIILAIGSILIAPMVAKAPQGLYQLLQQLNGIFFIPMATMILAALFMPWISTLAAKAGLIFGLLFYIVMQYILQVDLHFVHIWGLEFVLNIVFMSLLSWFYKPSHSYVIKDMRFVDMSPWKYTLPLGIILMAVTVAVYLVLGNLN